ncbi:MAG: hypothetical protein AB1589_18010 [Cyanobacteriota bacterium]
MTSSNTKGLETTPVSHSQSQMPTDLLLSLAVGPMLLGVLATDALVSWLTSVGIGSEEVFRGERLPVLHFPESRSEE